MDFAVFVTNEMLAGTPIRATEPCGAESDDFATWKLNAALLGGGLVDVLDFVQHERRLA